MVNNIKTFDERIKELVDLGKEQGFLTYEQIAKKTLDINKKIEIAKKIENINKEVLKW